MIQRTLTLFHIQLNVCRLIYENASKTENFALTRLYWHCSNWVGLEGECAWSCLTLCSLQQSIISIDIYSHKMFSYYNDNYSRNVGLGDFHKVRRSSSLTVGRSQKQRLFCVAGPFPVIARRIQKPDYIEPTKTIPLQLGLHSLTL